MSTINLNNHMNYDNEPLVKALGSQNAEGVKELNNSKEYEWMKNKWGVLVPVATHLVNDKLRRGFIRTDGVVHSDDPKDQVVAPNLETNPAKAMAMVAEQLAESSKVQAEVVKELVRGRKSKKVNQNEEETGE